MKKCLLILFSIMFLVVGVANAATQFEEFVNTELPKRISTDVPPSGNLSDSKYLRTTGIGLGVEVVDAPSGGEIIVKESDGTPTITGVTTLEFDQDTGLEVSDEGSDTAKISIGSHWKNIEIDGQSTLIPSGQETIEFIEGDDIELISNDLSNPQSIEFHVGDDVTRDIEWDTITEIEDATSVNIITDVELDDALSIDGAFLLSFDNSDLSAGSLTVNHDLQSMYVSVSIYDNNKNLIIPDEVTLVDSSNFTVDLGRYVPITGTWNVLVLSNGSNSNFPDSYIDGFYPMWADGNTLTIVPGEGICNGKYFKVNSNTNLNLTSLASTEDFHYIYIDYSDSTFPDNISVYDSTTEPAKDTVKLGYYDGNDRCIGVAFCTSSGLIMRYLTSDGKRYQLATGNLIANSMTPDGSWQIPNVDSGYNYTPVNAIGAFVQISNDDTADKVEVAITTREWGMVPVNWFNSGGTILQRNWVYAMINDWLELGNSRQLRVYGEFNDNSSLTAYILGYEIER